VKFGVSSVCKYEGEKCICGAAFGLQKKVKMEKDDIDM